MSDQTQIPVIAETAIQVLSSVSAQYNCRDQDHEPAQEPESEKGCRFAIGTIMFACAGPNETELGWMSAKAARRANRESS